MNLARVEQYFSDFLSSMESGEPVVLHEDPQVEAGEGDGWLLATVWRAAENRSDVAVFDTAGLESGPVATSGTA